MSAAEQVATLAARFGVTDLPPEGPMIPREHLLAFARALKDELGFGYFTGCTSVHYPAAGEDPDRTMVWYRVRRIPDGELGFRVTCPTGEAVPSLAGVWAGADWQEREQYDLVGTVFSKHPDLRRIMLPEDWEGHPLRRDYAIDTRHAPWR